MARKKITFIFIGISIVMVVILITSYKVVTKFNNINQNKGEDIIQKHQEWMHQIITLSDTIPIKTKNHRDSIIKAELKFLKTNDSLLKLNKKRETVIN